MRLNNENVKSEKSEKLTSEYHLFLPDGLNEEQMELKLLRCFSWENLNNVSDLPG